MRIKVLDIELEHGLKPIWGVEKYDRLYVLVRYYGQPVGWLGIPNSLREPVITGERVRAFMTEQMGWELLLNVLGQRFQTGTPDVPQTPISIVVCAQNRTLQLERCLQSLLSLDYPHNKYEIIVVDSTTDGDEIEHLVADLPVRYAREKLPGLNQARNRGIAEASNEIVAFIANNAFADRLWLQSIARAFADPEVMAVTGLIAPAELETMAQVLFEFSYGGLDRGLVRRTFRRRTLRTRDMLEARGFGHGANMAFRTNLFTSVRPFDIAFDVNVPSGTGGDIELLHRIVARGHTLVYEPTALVWHTHERHTGSLRRTIYSNSQAFGAYLLFCMRNRTIKRRSVLRFFLATWLGQKTRALLPRSHRQRKPARVRLYGSPDLPRRLAILDSAGALLSPLAYYSAARRHIGAWRRIGHDE